MRWWWISIWAAFALGDAVADEDDGEVLGFLGLGGEGD